MNKNKKKKFSVSKMIHYLLILFGVSIIFYPLANKFYVSYKEKQELKVAYQEKISEESKQELLAIKEKAQQDINNGEFNTVDFLDDSADKSQAHKERIAILRIPKIDSVSSVYEGISDEVLDRAVGILPKTNLPFGGVNSNSVLVAHRGTAVADLFRRLDEVELGDYIFIDNRVTEETLAYKVISYEVVTPDEGDKIKVHEDKDLITLITCTPYLINSHRILITAERDLNYVKEDFSVIQQQIDAPVISTKTIPAEYYYLGGFIGVAGVFYLILFLVKRRKKKNEKNSK